jgi:3-hydroxyisobutyrate dehydrogenase-like beta-hydroxyacid dehydrogenase
VPSSREYTGGFGVTLMAKDMGLAVDAAEEIGAKLILGKAAREVYDKVGQEDEFKSKDFSSVFKWIQSQKI